MLGPSKRAEEVKPFVVMKILAAATQLENPPPIVTETGEEKPSTKCKVLHLEIGEPSTGAPQTVTTAAIKSLTDPTVTQGYTASLGMRSLRDSIANLYEKRYGVHVNGNEVAVTSGSSGAFVAVFTACFNTGDRVAICVPSYPCYKNVLEVLGIKVVLIPVDATTGWQLTIKHLEEAQMDEPLHGVIVASPGNPTGSLMTKAQLQGMAAFCTKNDVRLILDEIYHGITEEDAVCALEVCDNVIVINSFSKYWCMTGYRIGWAIVRDTVLMEAIERIVQNMSICSPVVSQYAALSALQVDCSEELDRNVRRYFANMKMLSASLQEAGFVVNKPGGAYYLYTDCHEVCRIVGVKGSSELCELLLKEAKVATTPGLAFDEKRGEKYIRFSCAGSEEDVREAGQKVVALVQSHMSG